MRISCALTVAMLLASATAWSAGCGKTGADEPGTAAAGEPKSAAAPAAVKPQVERKAPKVGELEVLDLEQLKTRIKAGKKKLTVVAMWATWCAPCIEEMPAFSKLHRDMADKGVAVLGLCVDDRAQLGKKIQAVFDDKNPSYAQALLKPDHDETFFKGLGVEWDGGLPVTLVFDAEAKKLAYTRDAMNDQRLTQLVESHVGR